MSQLNHGQIYKLLLRGLGRPIEVVADEITEIVEADRKAMQAELTKEREAKETMREVLEWYADEPNYIQEKIEFDEGDFGWDSPNVMDDGGFRARTILKKGNEPNG